MFYYIIGIIKFWNVFYFPSLNNRNFQIMSVQTYSSGLYSLTKSVIPEATDSWMFLSHRSHFWEQQFLWEFMEKKYQINRMFK